MTLSTSAVMHRLFAIEDELRQLQDPYADAAERFAGADRSMKKFLARAYLNEDGTQKEREAKALTALADDDLYYTWVGAEAELSRIRALVQLLESRATIGESLLKKMSVDPAWVAG